MEWNIEIIQVWKYVKYIGNDYIYIDVVENTSEDLETLEYKIHYASDDNFTTYKIACVLNQTEVYRCKLENLKYGKKYRVKVQASNFNGEGPLSDYLADNFRFLSFNPTTKNMQFSWTIDENTLTDPMCINSKYQLRLDSNDSGTYSLSNSNISALSRQYIVNLTGNSLGDVIKLYLISNNPLLDLSSKIIAFTLGIPPTTPSEVIALDSTTQDGLYAKIKYNKYTVNTGIPILSYHLLVDDGSKWTDLTGNLENGVSNTDLFFIVNLKLFLNKNKINSEIKPCKILFFKIISL